MVPADLEFALSSRRLTNGTVVVAATGEVDLHTSSQLGRALEELAAEGVRRVVVDLSDVTFVDSTGLHALLCGARQLERENGELIVVVPDPKVRRVFEITGFDRLISIVSSLPAVAVSS